MDRFTPLHLMHIRNTSNFDREWSPNLYKPQVKIFTKKCLLFLVEHMMKNLRIITF